VPRSDQFASNSFDHLVTFRPDSKPYTVRLPVLHSMVYRMTTGTNRLRLTTWKLCMYLFSDWTRMKVTV